MRLLSAILVLAAASSAATSAGASVLCPGKFVIHANATISLDGKLYADRARLVARLRDYKGVHPDCYMSVTMDKGTSDKTMGVFLTLLQDAGFARVGFLTEPENDR